MADDLKEEMEEKEAVEEEKVKGGLFKIGPFKDRPISRRKLIVNSIRAAVVLGVAKGVYNTSSFNIRTEKVEVKIPDLPAELKGFKIAQLTDLHSSMVVTENLINSAAEAAMKESPDMIALTGDFISGSTKFLSGSVGEFNEGHLAKCVRALKPLKAPHGVYAVLGNHDFWSGEEAVGKITAAFEGALGVKWLRNTNVTITKGKARLDILGVDDHWENSYSLRKAYEGTGDGRCKILLSHNPDATEDIWHDMKIDLVLSGHTHGGQIVAPIVGMPFLPSRFGQKYRAGLVKGEKVQTYISRGVGHLLAPIRINCPPEVTIITLA